MKRDIRKGPILLLIAILLFSTSVNASAYPLIGKLLTHHNNRYNNQPEIDLNSTGISSKFAWTDIELDIISLISTISGSGLPTKDGKFYFQIIFNLKWTNAYSQISIVDFVNMSLESHNGITNGAASIFFGYIQKNTRVGIQNYRFNGITINLDIEY